MYRVTIFQNENDQTGIEIHSPYSNELKVESNNLKPSINDIGTFSFTIYPNNPGWVKIKPLRTLVKVEDAIHHFVVFEGRVLGPTSDMESSGELSESYICEDEKGYLHDSIQSFKKFEGIRTAEQLFREAIRVHNEQVEPYKRFVIGNIELEDLTENIRFIDDTQSTFDTITDKLLNNDNIGGEIRIRKEKGVRYIDWIKEVGSFVDVPIVLAKNLVDMSKEVDPTDVVTVLFPRGERLESDDNEQSGNSTPRLTISDVNNGKEFLLADQGLIEVFGYQAGCVVWDDITQSNILKTRGQQWLNNQFVATGRYSITALDLSLIGIDPHRFWVGNTHPVINPLLDVNGNLRIVDMNININSPEKTIIYIGDRQLTMSQYQQTLTKEMLQVQSIRSSVNHQGRSIGNLRINLGLTEQRLTELQSQVDSGTGEIENQISSILDEIQLIVGEMGNIAASIPSEQTMRDIHMAISSLNDFVDAQRLVNDDFESRIKKLEPEEEED